MRTIILKRAWQAFGQTRRVRRSGSIAILGALLLAAANVFAGATVNWLSGGPNTGYPSGAGYVNGDTALAAEYHTPCGLAMDVTGQYLFVADRDNNAIRYLDLDAGWTWPFTVSSTNLVSKPVSVAVDNAYNVYVLSRGNGNNGSVATFDSWGDLMILNAAGLTNAAGMALDPSGNIYVTVRSNRLIRIDAGTTNRTTIASNFPAGTSLQGIVVKRNGLIAACYSGRNGIYLINPTNGVVTTNAGFHGAGDFTTNGPNTASSSTAKFNQPMNVAETGDGTLIVTDYGTHRIKRVMTTGVVTNLYGVNAIDWVTPYKGFMDGTVKTPDLLGGVAARQPFGVVFAPDGTVYTTETYYHIIRHISGAGLALLPPLPPQPPGTPTGLSATAIPGQINLTWNASVNATNYNLRRSTTNGGPYIVIASTALTSYADTNIINGTNYYYVVSASNAGGESANSAEVSIAAPFPPAPQIYTITAVPGEVSLSWSTSAGATGYKVKRSTDTNTYTTIVTTTTTSYTDTGVINGQTYYYVVSALTPGGESTNSLPSSILVPYSPVPDPQIGYVTFPPFAIGSVFHQIYSVDFYNDSVIVIKGTPGSSTYYTYADTNDVAGVPDPTSPPHNNINSSYTDGLSLTAVSNNFAIHQVAPTLIIKAIGEQTSRSNSAVVAAQFHFIVGDPVVTGTNAARFAISDITDNAQFWYTTDGSDPTNTTSTAVNSNNTSLLLLVNTNGIAGITKNFNFWLKVRGFKDNYQPSAIVSNLFLAANFSANAISFGFDSGEASSDFVASPGQTFYAPVTMAPLPETVIYSLQFNLTVTNAGPNPGPAIGAGTYSFTSMLRKPDPDNPGFYLQIPPYMFINWYTNPVAPWQLVNYEGTNFVDLTIDNPALNLLGVGWLERYGQTNLYITKSQDLLQYSQAHDTLFLQAGGHVVLGGYSFLVPGNATNGQTYRIQIDRPSATLDGVGAPGSSVFIFAPTNGSLAGGAANSIKYVTAGQRKYIVGDAYPFRWFNAGDFGNTNLENADVQQVFNSAIYGFNNPMWQAPGSDFADSMDSCGNVGTWDGQTGYYTNNSVYPYWFPYTIIHTTNIYDINTNLLSTANGVSSYWRQIFVDTIVFASIDITNSIFPGATNYTYNTNIYHFPDPYVPNLFDGSDLNINELTFGDGRLDVCDVYVTYRRSMDPSLTWYQRFWTNGVRVAETVSNLFNPGVTTKTLSAAKFSSLAGKPGASSSITNQPKVVFTAGDIQTTAGQTVSIPITASILGSYPLRLLMLNLTVVPLDGSPALTTPVSFSYNSALGTPWTTAQQGNGNYAAAWLSSGIAGLTGDVSLGTLTVTLPATATSTSAYAVHFDHASASPNGLASFPKLTRTGLITLANRSGSSFSDGIPDSWRLRYFLTLNNYLSATNADADGDGQNNLQEYAAGTDPTDASSSFKNIGTDPAAAQQPNDFVISWPSAIGKQYVILRSSSLSAPVWTSIATNNGTGNIMEYHDTTGGGNQYYRVRVQ